jgi:hypothetical protein
MGLIPRAPDSPVRGRSVPKRRAPTRPLFNHDFEQMRRTALGLANLIAESPVSTHPSIYSLADAVEHEFVAGTQEAFKGGMQLQANADLVVHDQLAKITREYYELRERHNNLQTRYRVLQNISDMACKHHELYATTNRTEDRG